VTINLQIEGIEKRYRAVKALDSVSLNAEGGQIVVVIGANGAGKTTLLRIIAGLDKPDKGTIHLSSKVLTDGELRQATTLVFQKTAMFSGTVYDNLAYGLRIRGQPEAEIKQKITDALSIVGLKNFEKRRAKKSSGGEQQRISLGRALLLNPKILLLDEPTANLDPNSSRIIEGTISSRRNDDTIIILATHNLGQAKRLADIVVHMHEGKVIQATKTKDLFENPEQEITRKFVRGELES
jgi:tungstate transport system ATP-binding protein